MVRRRRRHGYRILLLGILQRVWVRTETSPTSPKRDLALTPCCSVFQNYYLLNQLSDKSTSAVSWIGSLQVFFLLSGNIVGGPLFDRYGGLVAWPPALVLVFSVMMTSLCKEYYQFMLCQGVLGGIAMGMVYVQPLQHTHQITQRVS